MRGWISQSSPVEWGRRRVTEFQESHVWTVGGQTKKESRTASEENGESTMSGK